ncbi:MAG: hypothetical protein NVS3B19_01980 [Ginsengibacter sp.]
MILVITGACAQDNKYVTIPAGKQYERSHFYQKYWGKNYRKEWITPVKFPILMLDTVKGGLSPDAEGGGHQTTTLHLISKDKKKYVIRSVDKSFAKLVPKDFRNTFIDHIAEDEISMSFPYGALAVPYMEEKAGIFHADPKYYYVPRQPLLDTFNKKYGDKLYLFEEKPENDWTGTNNFGHFDKYTSSEKVMDKIMESGDYQVDQRSFIKDRLFDILIGDWDRHDKQWKWGSIDSGKFKLYKPVPVDRDQAFSTMDGSLQKLVISVSGMKYLKPFDYKITNVETADYERRILDRWFSNKLNLKDWLDAAEFLKAALTDQVITTSISQLPPEIFAIRGAELIAKLKSRRDNLTETAGQYYKFLAKEVEIPGTTQNDFFEINRLANDNIGLNIYKIKKDGTHGGDPFYSRIFNPAETEEIRLFGLSGNDVYTINGSSDKGLRIRIIGGDQHDSIIDNSNGGRKVHIYDDNNNFIKYGHRDKVHYISDSASHAFDFDTFRPDRKGLSPVIFYNDEDRFFVGLAYSYLHHKWRKLPYAFDQKISAHYSISQKAPSFNYDGLFPLDNNKLVLVLKGYYDAIRWVNFYGLGNESQFTTPNTNFFRLQTEEYFGSIGLTRRLGDHYVRFSGFAGATRIVHDPERYVAKNYTANDINAYKFNNYVGAKLDYNYTNVNDSIVPTKGIDFGTGVAYTNNISRSNNFATLLGYFQFYLPLGNKFSIAVKNGAGILTGNPLFYQYLYIGGSQSLRGYNLERYWGKSVFYNQNEIRYITKLNGYWYRGKVGLFAFFDDGRVWLEKENSNTIHTSYGGGLILSPFNKILLKATYGISKETKLFQFSLGRTI